MEFFIYNIKVENGCRVPDKIEITEDIIEESYNASSSYNWSVEAIKHYIKGYVMDKHKCIITDCDFSSDLQKGIEALSTYGIIGYMSLKGDGYE